MTNILYCNDCQLGIFNNFHPTNGDGEGTDIIIIGESPGNTEVKKGKPFTNKAGKLLRKILQKYNLLSYCYLTNIVKCRPPYDRTPRDIEVSHCMKHLYKEIITKKPKIIITLGSTVMKALYPYKIYISVNSYSFTAHGNKIIGVAYHPSYILHNPKELPNFDEFFSKVSTIYAHINPYYNKPQK